MYSNNSLKYTHYYCVIAKYFKHITMRKKHRLVLFMVIFICLQLAILFFLVIMPTYFNCVY